MSEKINILVVDDDPIFNFLTIKLIGRLNVPVNFSSHLNGKLALEYLQQEYNHSDSFIVLLDINMPVMNGWEFLDELVKRNYSDKLNIKIHIVSSSIDQRDIIKSGTYKNVVKYVKKPLKQEDCEEILEM